MHYYIMYIKIIVRILIFNVTEYWVRDTLSMAYTWVSEGIHSCYSIINVKKMNE